MKIRYDRLGPQRSKFIRAQLERVQRMGLRIEGEWTPIATSPWQYSQRAAGWAGSHRVELMIGWQDRSTVETALCMFYIAAVPYIGKGLRYDLYAEGRVVEDLPDKLADLILFGPEARC